MAKQTGAAEVTSTSSIHLDQPQTTETVISSLVPPLPTPTLFSKNSGLFSVRAAVVINASVEKVFDATTNVAGFGEWNTFVPSAIITSVPKSPTPQTNGSLQIGTEMVFQARLKPNASPHASTEIVTVIEDISFENRNGKRIAWKAGKQWGLKAERVQEIIEVESGRTEYVTWETFGGPLAYVLKMLYGGDLVERFEDWGRDLKGFCESNGIGT